MKVRHAIAYAYPGSIRAEELGLPWVGCWYVQEQVLREDDTWSAPYVAPGTGSEGFAVIDDPDLLALLAECIKASNI